MSEHKVPPGWWDYLTFEENRRRFPAEELMKYGGQCIAWSIDGTRIVASGKDVNELCARLDALGIDVSQVVHSYVDPPDVSNLC